MLTRTVCKKKAPSTGTSDSADPPSNVAEKETRLFSEVLVDGATDTLEVKSFGLRLVENPN